MTRYLDGAETELYRVKVQRLDREDNSTYVYYRGPYATPGAANGQKSRILNGVTHYDLVDYYPGQPAPRYEYKVTIESTDLNWK
jgi:hypothetical protein